MRQFGGEVHRMLAGSAADFEYPAAVGKPFAQHGQDRRTVLLAGF